MDVLFWLIFVCFWWKRSVFLARFKVGFYGMNFFGWFFVLFMVERIDFLALSIAVYVFALMLLRFIYKNWFWWNNKLHSQGWVSKNEFDGKLYYLHLVKKRLFMCFIFFILNFFLMKILIPLRIWLLFISPRSVKKKRVKHL